MDRRSITIIRSATARSTASALLAAGGIHVLWATGSSFPFRTRAALADTVVGRQVTPGPTECLGVAVLLAAAAAVVTSADRGHGRWSRTAAGVVAAALATRAALGFTGRTSLVVPGSESPRFTRMDRRVYSPICALLAAGAATAAG